jgi:hypothetical protein
MVGDEQQRPPARHVVPTLYAHAPAHPLQRPRAAHPEASLADDPVEGQDLARKTPGRYVREGLEHRPTTPQPTQTEGGDHIVDANPRKPFETLQVLRGNDALFLSPNR